MVAALRGEGFRRRRDILRIDTRRRLQVVAGDMAMILLADGDVVSTIRARERECISAGSDLGLIRETRSVKGRREPVDWPLVRQSVCRACMNTYASLYVM